MAETSFPQSAKPLDVAFFAGLIDAIGTGAFFEQMANQLEQVLPFEGLLVFLYSENKAPASLGCFRDAANIKLGVENYQKYTYVLNPVYRAFKNDVAPGVYLIADLLPPGFTKQIARADIHIRIDDDETIGYRTPGWPKYMTEVLALVRLPNNNMLELSFLTRRAGDQTGHCQTGLAKIYPALSSALRKHFEFATDDFDTSKSSPSQEFHFQEFGQGILTEREQSVVKMILLGHSSNSIALNLGISLSTVKSHRRNIYAKMNISSQAELFNNFVQTLMETG